MGIEEYQKLLEQLEELESIQAYDDAILLNEEEIPFELVISEIENSRKWTILLRLKKLFLTHVTQIEKWEIWLG